MNRVFRMTAVALLIVFLFAGCMTHVHTVGAGPQTGQVVTQRQWYVLWGLVDINAPDTAEMAAGADDYEITTEFTVLDVVIGMFTGIATVYPRSVSVTR